MNKGDRVSQDQFFDIITRKELSWQSIIYDLIKTEQLNPWDIDIGLLAEKYLEAIHALEESDFHVPSKVLLACSLLLRLKSEILVNSFIPELDALLYGRGDEKTYELERIEIDEDELPLLVPRTPMARNRKVTLTELMSALEKAINTESRRIKKEIKTIQAKKSAELVLPQKSHIPLKVRITNIFSIIRQHLGAGKQYTYFHHVSPGKEEQLASFVPLLHLSNNQQLYLHQPLHFKDIHISMQMHPDDKKLIEQELTRHDEEQEDFDTSENQEVESIS